MTHNKTEARRLALTAGAAAAMMLCLYAALDIWPFGRVTVVTGDLGGQYVPYFSHFTQALQSGGWAGMLYGFDKSLGGSLAGILAYYCASPLNLLYLLVKVENYPLMATAILFIKVVLACTFMCFYLGRRFGGESSVPGTGSCADGGKAPILAPVLPALCYGFCAYSFVYSQNIMWHDVLLMLPLIAYGIWRLCRTGRPFFYAAALGLALFADFYIGYMACIFSVLYFFYELALSAPAGKRWGRCFGFGGASLIAGGLAAVMLVPAYLDVQVNKGLGAGMELTGGTAFKWSEFFYRLLPFNFTWADVEAGLPNVYAGTLALVLTVVFFAARGISRKEKLAGGAMLTVLFLSMLSADLVIFWHAMVKPVWFPYRHSFLFCFWMCFLAARALDSAQLTWKRCIPAAVIGLAVLAAAFLVRNVWFTMTLLCIGALLCGANAAGFLALRSGRAWLRRLAAAGLCLLCAAELVANGVFCVRQFENRDADLFADHVRRGTAVVQSISDDGVFAARAEKTYFLNYNDPLLLRYPGISHFGSTQDNASTDLLDALGYKNINLYTTGSTAFADAALGIRYVWGKTAKELPVFCENIRGIDGLWLGENPYAFPLSYFVPDTGLFAGFDADPFAYQQQLFEALGGEGALFAPCEVDGELGDDLTGAEYAITVPADGLVYVTMASGSWQPVQLSCGEVYDSYFGGLGSGTAALGRFAAGETAVLSVTPDWGLCSIDGVRAMVLDEEKLAALAETLRANAGETRLTAAEVTVTLPEAAPGGRYLISVPATKFVKVELDGEAVTAEAGPAGFLALQLAPGAHSIRVVPAANGFVPGLAVSLAAAAALCAWYFVYRKRAKAA